MKTPALQISLQAMEALQCFQKALWLLIYTYIPASFIGCTFTAPILLFLLDVEKKLTLELIFTSMLFGGVFGTVFSWIIAIPAFIVSIPVIMLLLIKNNKNLLVWVSFGAIIGGTNAGLLGMLLDATKEMKFTIGMSAIPTAAVVGGLMGFSMWQKVSTL